MNIAGSLNALEPSILKSSILKFDILESGTSGPGNAPGNKGLPGVVCMPAGIL